MSLIQLLKFRTWKMGLFKIPHCETLCFQMGTRVTVASGLSKPRIGRILMYIGDIWDVMRHMRYIRGVFGHMGCIEAY